MKEEIRKICTQLNNGQIAVTQATEKLLDLFSVSGRSEQLCDYCKKPLESTCCNDCLEEMDNHNH
jgi:hypothetical protein